MSEAAAAPAAEKASTDVSDVVTLVDTGGDTNTFRYDRVGPTVQYGYVSGGQSVALGALTDVEIEDGATDGVARCFFMANQSRMRWSADFLPAEAAKLAIVEAMAKKVNVVVRHVIRMTDSGGDVNFFSTNSINPKVAYGYERAAYCTALGNLTAIQFMPPRGDNTVVVFAADGTASRWTAEFGRAVAAAKLPLLLEAAKAARVLLEARPVDASGGQHIVALDAATDTVTYAFQQGTNFQTLGKLTRLDILDSEEGTSVTCIFSVEGTATQWRGTLAAADAEVLFGVVRRSAAVTVARISSPTAFPIEGAPPSRPHSFRLVPS